MLSLHRTICQHPDPEVPLRVLIDKALTRGYVLSPLAAPHHRRDGLVLVRPSAKGKQKWPSPDGGRGHHSLAYEQKSRLLAYGSQHEPRELPTAPTATALPSDGTQGTGWARGEPRRRTSASHKADTKGRVNVSVCTAGYWSGVVPPYRAGRTERRERRPRSATADSDRAALFGFQLGQPLPAVGSPLAGQ
jgi:hypothetical protein